MAVRAVRSSRLSTQPQEIELWHVLPALRRELAEALAEEGKAQKEIAKLLGVTEAAVSQYVHSKRAQKVKFGREFAARIKRVAGMLAKREVSAYEALLALCREFKECGGLCKLHRSVEKVPRGCRLCRR